MTSEELKLAMAKAQEKHGYLQRASEARQTPEWRKAARERGVAQFSSEDAKIKSREFAKKGWNSLTEEQRKERGHKALMTRKYNMAKKNGRVLHLDIIAVEGQ